MRKHKLELTIVFILAVLAGMAFSASSVFGQCANGRCCNGGTCSTGKWVWTYYGWQWQRNTPNDIVTTEDKTEEPKMEDSEQESIPEPAKLETIPKTFRERALERINWYRAQRGLPMLSLDPKLCDACDSHSRFMGVYGFQHAYGAGMECIATGTASPESTVDMWMNSPSHASILMSGRILGIGNFNYMWTARIR